MSCSHFKVLAGGEKRGDDDAEKDICGSDPLPPAYISFESDLAPDSYMSVLLSLHRRVALARDGMHLDAAKISPFG
jgi:hypothetical protein